MQIRFRPEADAELVDARLWYSLQRDGLDAVLMMRVEQTLAQSPHLPAHILLFIETFDGLC